MSGLARFGLARATVCILGVAVATAAFVRLLPDRAIDDPGVLDAADRRAKPVSIEGIASRHFDPSPGLDAVFDPGGARIFDSARKEDSDALASLRLVGIGRGAAREVVGRGEVVSVGERLEIRRPGIVEWFEKRIDGLEHGLSIASREPGSSPLWIDLEVSPATARGTGDSVLLSTPSGRRLEYAKLEVFDGTGARIAAQFEVPDPSRIRLVVDDLIARYPLTIDPLLTGAIVSILSSDQPSSVFGYSVASAGDVNADGFDDVIVGAYQYSAPATTSSGAAFVFLGSTNGIPTANVGAAATKLFGTENFQYFGVSVAGAGDVNGDGYDDVIVGSNYSNGQADEGAAFIFHGGPGGISNGTSADANAVLQGDQVDSAFGYSVSSAGDVDGDGRGDVIVGAPGFDDDAPGGPLVDAGAAFVFVGGPAGVVDAGSAAASARLTSLQTGSAFGFSVASAGDVNGDARDDVIVGARHFSAGQPDEGAAFIYHGSPTGVASGTTTTAASILESDDPDGQLFDVGPAGDVNGDGFDDVVVGIPLRASTDEGAVFLYMGGPAGVPSGGALSATILASDQYFASFGSRARAAGDVNDDGYSDLVVGASRYSLGQAVEGAAFIFLGRAEGIPAGTAETAFERIELNDAGAMLGTSVSGAGDVNGDGFSDVIAGAPNFGGADVGAAYVWRGGDADSDEDGLSDRAETRIHHTDPWLVDTDGDGYDDGLEVADGTDPIDGGDPLRVNPPYSSPIVSFSSSTDWKSYRVEFSETLLPTRPKLVARAYPDEHHADMNVAVEIRHCVIDGPSEPIICADPPPYSPALVPSAERNADSYPLWLCTLTHGLLSRHPGHCIVRVRPLDFGTSGAPANMSLVIRAETEVPTWTLPPTNVTPAQPVTGRLNSGTTDFFNEGQNFRWIYDTNDDRVLFTPISGRCEWSPLNAKRYEVSYTYQFQGSPGYAGLDCCTWEITSSTGPVGTGQAIYFVNVDGNDPANQPGDLDRDGIKDLCDNCRTVPNGPLLGTCQSGSRLWAPCRSSLECPGGACSLAQDDADKSDELGNVCAAPEPDLTGSLVAGSVLLRFATRRRRRSWGGSSWQHSKSRRELES